MSNILRFLLLAFALLFSTLTFADYQIAGVGTFPTAQAACDAAAAGYAEKAYEPAASPSSSGFVGECVYGSIYNPRGTIKAVYLISTTCEKKYDSGMFWGASSAPSTFCDGSCEWQVQKSSCGADYNQDGTFTGESSCAYSAETNGNTCSTQTGTPQNPTPSPPPPLSPCGPGKTAGVINGTTICVNNDSPPPNCTKDSYGNYNCVPKDPNTPPPPTPGSGSGCTSNCNNTTNNNTTNNNTTNNNTTNNNTTNNTTNNSTVNNITNNEAPPPVDLSPIIDKLAQVDTGIKALDTAIKSVGTGIKAVETAINTTSQTITNAVNAVKDKVTDVKNSVDAAATQAKTDAATQKAATDAAKEQAKTDAATQKAATDAAKEQAKTDAKTQKDATDDVKKAIEDQTAQDKTWRDWLKGDGKTVEDIAGPTPQVPTSDLGDSMPGLDGNLISYGKQCPSDKTLAMPGFGGTSFSYTFKFSEWCNALIFIGLLVKVMAYLHAGYIVLGASRN